MTVAEIIKRFEGFSDKLYKCQAGKWTIGYGYNIEDRGLPKDICDELLSRDIAMVSLWLRENFVWYERLSDARKKAVISMVYQLGETRFLGFKKFLAALNSGNYELAYVEMLNSRWARQTPERAKKTALVIRTGDDRYFM